jgi:hypothetical protein
MGGGWTQALNSPVLIFDHELKQTELQNPETIP